MCNQDFRLPLPEVEKPHIHSKSKFILEMNFHEWSAYLLINISTVEPHSTSAKNRRYVWYNLHVHWIDQFDGYAVPWADNWMWLIRVGMDHAENHFNNVFSPNQQVKAVPTVFSLQNFNVILLREPQEDLQVMTADMNSWRCSCWASCSDDNSASHHWLTSDKCRQDKATQDTHDSVPGISLPCLF